MIPERRRPLKGSSARGNPLRPPRRLDRCYAASAVCGADVSGVLVPEGSAGSRADRTRPWPWSRALRNSRTWPAGLSRTVLVAESGTAATEASGSGIKPRSSWPSVSDRGRFSGLGLGSLRRRPTCRSSHGRGSAMAWFNRSRVTRRWGRSTRDRPGGARGPGEPRRRRDDRPLIRGCGRSGDHSPRRASAGAEAGDELLELPRVASVRGVEVLPLGNESDAVVPLHAPMPEDPFER